MSDKKEIIKSLKESIETTKYLIDFINEIDSNDLKTKRINRLAVMLCISDLVSSITNIEIDIYKYIRSLEDDKG